MLCRRCPHVVRHGKVTETGDIEFSNGCGLNMKKATNPEISAKDKPKPSELSCDHYPFSSDFDYFKCEYYVKTFCISEHKNDVAVIGDVVNSSDSLACSDMNLL